MYIIMALTFAGTLFLWIFWPSFNGALASGNAQYRAVINTYYAMTGSVLASFVFSAFLSKEHKFNMVRLVKFSFDLFHCRRKEKKKDH